MRGSSSSVELEIRDLQPFYFKVNIVKWAFGVFQDLYRKLWPGIGILCTLHLIFLSPIYTWRFYFKKMFMLHDIWLLPAEILGIKELTTFFQIWALPLVKFGVKDGLHKKKKTCYDLSSWYRTCSESAQTRTFFVYISLVKVSFAYFSAHYFLHDRLIVIIRIKVDLTDQVQSFK